MSGDNMAVLETCLATTRGLAKRVDALEKRTIAELQALVKRVSALEGGRSMSSAVPSATRVHAHPYKSPPPPPRPGNPVTRAAAPNPVPAPAPRVAEPLAPAPEDPRAALITVFAELAGALGVRNPESAVRDVFSLLTPSTGAQSAATPISPPVDGSSEPIETSAESAEADNWLETEVPDAPPAEPVETTHLDH
jgi:hypothetical protein